MVKVRALADFMAEFTEAPGLAPESSEKTVDKPGEYGQSASDQSIERWKLFVDGSSNSKGSEAGLDLVSPDQYNTSQAFHFNFKASNNEAEYERS